MLHRCIIMTSIYSVYYTPAASATAFTFGRYSVSIIPSIIASIIPSDRILLYFVDVYIFMNEISAP